MKILIPNSIMTIKVPLCLMVLALVFSSCFPVKNVPDVRGYHIIEGVENA